MTTRTELIAEARTSMREQKWMPALLAIRMAEALEAADRRIAELEAENANLRGELTEVHYLRGTPRPATVENVAQVLEEGDGFDPRTVARVLTERFTITKKGAGE